MIEIDKSLSELQYSPVCTFCKHETGFRKCKAFDLIPLEIWEGKNDHTKPYKGDNGIRFKKVKG